MFTTVEHPRVAPAGDAEFRSEQLAGQHRRHCRKQRDAEGRERVLTLRDGHAGDHTGTKARNGQLGEQLAAITGSGAWRHGR